MKQRIHSKGFTIIEVVLVLAIAALIFLVVLMAVPALQRSQRDQQRRSDLGRLETAIISYSGNHQSSLPSPVDASFVYKYVRANGTDKFEDPRGNTTTYSSSNQYRMVSNALTTAPDYSATDNAMVYRVGQLCDASSPSNPTTTTGAGSRSFAVLIPLENGDVYCQDNH